MDLAYERSWGSLMPALAAASSRSPRTIGYLHLPKTGGSSLTHAIEYSPGWLKAQLPLSLHGGDTCSCGQPDCVDGNFRRNITNLAERDPDSLDLFVKFPHERWKAVSWTADQLHRRGGRFNVIYTAVRPIRQRLVSMFADYWTQVSWAAAHDAGTMELSEHRLRIVSQYQADSRHYVTRGGRIDGKTWFSAFAEHGGGIPFFLSDVFDGAPDALEAELDSGFLVPVPTHQMDGFITGLTGNPPVSRRRVSEPANRHAVQRAVKDASGMIDRLAERDAKFDEILARRLGLDRFVGR